MNIKERITKLGKYFKEMQITNIDGTQIIYVVVSFPIGWIVDENIEEKFGISVRKNEGTPGEYYFLADIETGEAPIFDAIDYNINKMKSAIERGNLLKEKTNELRAIFEDEDVTLEELKTLTITYTKLPPEVPAHEEIIPLQTKKRGKKKEEKKDE